MRRAGLKPGKTNTAMEALHMADYTDRWPFADDLRPRQKLVIREWKLLEVEVEGAWRDDHEACYGLRVTYCDLDKPATYRFRVSAWWLSSEGTLMLFRATARRPKALRELQALLREQIEAFEEVKDEDKA